MACGEEDINPHWNAVRTATDASMLGAENQVNHGYDWQKHFERLSRPVPLPLSEWTMQYIEKVKGEPKMGVDPRAVMQQVTIIPVLNGFTVKIGCKTLVFEKMETLCKELIRYSKDPNAVEKEYLKREI